MAYRPNSTYLPLMVLKSTPRRDRTDHDKVGQYTDPRMTLTGTTDREYTDPRGIRTGSIRRKYKKYTSWKALNMEQINIQLWIELSFFLILLALLLKLFINYHWIIESRISSWFLPCTDKGIQIELDCQNLWTRILWRWNKVQTTHSNKMERRGHGKWCTSWTMRWPNIFIQFFNY